MFSSTWREFFATFHEPKNEYNGSNKNIENNSKKFTIDTQLTIRNRIIPIINNLSVARPLNNNNNIQLLRLHKLTKQYMKENPNFIFTRADKGNVTVALDKDNYTLKITELLNDVDTYSIKNSNS